jgi:hypothetical protein
MSLHSSPEAKIYTHNPDNYWWRTVVILETSPQTKHSTHFSVKWWVQKQLVDVEVARVQMTWGERHFLWWPGLDLPHSGQQESPAASVSSCVEGGFLSVSALDWRKKAARENQRHLGIEPGSAGSRCPYFVKHIYCPFSGPGGLNIARGLIPAGFPEDDGGS